MPNVLVLIKGLGLGGAERLVTEGVLSAIRNGSGFRYEVGYLLPHKNQLVPTLENAGITVHQFGGPSGSYRRAAAEFRKTSRTVDLVHAHLPSTGILARTVSRAPVVYTEHNIASSYRQPTRWLNRATYGRSAATTAVSEPVLVSLDGFPGAPPRLVNNGVAADRVTDARSSVRSEMGIDDSHHLLVHVGNIRPHKGHANLIAAVAALSRKRQDFVVLSAGTEKRPGDLDRVRDEAASAGVSDRIRFLGRRDDAHRLIQAGDALVNPSDVEGLPVVILESMYLGTPVVATDVGGVGTVISHGHTGWLVPPQHPEALAAQLSEVLDDEPSRKTVSHAASELVLRDYGIDRMVGEFESIYRSVLE